MRIEVEMKRVEIQFKYRQKEAKRNRRHESKIAGIYATALTRASISTASSNNSPWSLVQNIREK